MKNRIRSEGRVLAKLAGLLIFLCSAVSQAVEIKAAANMNYGIDTAATMLSTVQTAPDGLATYRIAFDVTASPGSAVISGSSGGDSTEESWGVGDGSNALQDDIFRGSDNEWASFDNLRIVDFLSNGSDYKAEDFSALSFTLISFVNAQTPDRDSVAFDVSGTTTDLGVGGVSGSPGVVNLEAVTGAELVEEFVLSAGNSPTQNTNKWSVASVGVSVNFLAERFEVRALGNMTNPPVLRDVNGNITTLQPGTVQRVEFDSVDYQGQSTRVFAWVSTPASASAVNPVPAIVLVHGGGGKAFKAWANIWSARGYAAISIDTEGYSQTTAETKYRTAYSGPVRTGIYADAGDFLEDQFMYHAVSASILANSLMRSQSFVDSNKVGISGISWGGVITATTIGIDPRFAFAIPIYGSADMDNAENWWGDSLINNELYRAVWDPMGRMHNADMPALWMSWPEEPNFPIDRQATSYRAAPGSRMVSLHLGMGHSHVAGWSATESYVFANNIVENGEMWAEQTRISEINGVGTVWFTSSQLLSSASLIYTTGTGVSSGRSWITTAASIVNIGNNLWKVTANIPSNTTGYYVNVTDGVNFASSGYQEVSSGSDISPFYKLNDGVWKNSGKVDSTIGDKINLIGHPNMGGTWSWSGPNGFNATTRAVRITNSATNSHAGDYTVTYTDEEGAISRDIFTIEF